MSSIFFRDSVDAVFSVNYESKLNIAAIFLRAQ